MKIENRLTITCNRPEFMEILLVGFQNKFGLPLDVAEIDVTQLVEKDKRENIKSNEFVIEVYKSKENSWFKEFMKKSGVPEEAIKDVPDKHE